MATKCTLVRAPSCSESITCFMTNSDSVNSVLSPQERLNCDDYINSFLLAAFFNFLNEVLLLCQTLLDAIIIYKTFSSIDDSCHRCLLLPGKKAGKLQLSENTVVYISLRERAFLETDDP